MLTIKRTLSFFTLIMLITACTGPDGQPVDLFTKENVGTIVGATGGAILGSNIGKGKGNTVAIATGTLLGAMVGKNVGASLDRFDKAYMGQASQQAFEYNKTGVASSWVNPDSGNAGSITPIRTFQQEEKYCREFSQTISVGGNSEQAYGIACRQPDGTWQIQ